MVLAAAVSGLDIEFIDGVVGGDIDPKTIDLVGDGRELRASELGIWRAHLNVYREIVHRNITSALIMEVSSPRPRIITRNHRPTGYPRCPEGCFLTRLDIG